MARLNIQKAIKSAEKLINNKSDISVNDINKIRDMSLDDWDMIIYGFKVGFWQGYKAAMREAERKQKGAA